jgi:hypothetical protein
MASISARRINSLKDSRLTELAISLFDKDPTDPAQVFTQAEINKLVADFNAEEKWVVANARKAGKSPSAAIMKLAKGRGFKPQVAQAQAAPAAAPAAPAVAPVKNGNGGAPAPTADAVSKSRQRPKPPLRPVRCLMAAAHLRESL